jgi:hypothetical protein
MLPVASIVPAPVSATPSPVVPTTVPSFTTVSVPPFCSIPVIWPEIRPEA